MILTLIGCGAIGWLDYVDPNASSDGSLGQLIFAILLTIGLGLLAAYLGYKFMQVGLYASCFAGGYLLGVLFYEVMLSWLNSPWLLGFCSFSSAWICAILCYKFQQTIIIIGTAFVGSYFFVRGVSIFVGGFPNEFLVYEEIKSNEFEFTMHIYAYIGGILGGWIIGAIFQWMWNRRSKITEGYTKA